MRRGTLWERNTARARLRAAATSTSTGLQREEPGVCGRRTGPPLPSSHFRDAWITMGMPERMLALDRLSRAGSLPVHPAGQRNSE